ncbi:MAG: hypothetical protein DCC55_03650 [Chloroflexi bacterium]|nr:MAG: hypothetical protein DCC55_03650 [Chloroflexota bacterium]
MNTYPNPPVAIPARHALASWWERFVQQGYYFRYVAGATILMGMCLHLTRLLIGDALTMQYVVTPTFDQYFVLPIAYAGISGLLSWRRMKFHSRGHKLFIGFIIFYMLISIPIHVTTWFTHSTAHLQLFPLWYSVVLQPVYAAMLVALWRVMFQPDTE